MNTQVSPVALSVDEWLHDRIVESSQDAQKAHSDALSSSCAIYVPSTIDVSSQADSSMVAKVLTDVRHAMALMFGGSTTILADGSYPFNGAFVDEPIHIVTSKCTSRALDENRSSIIAIAQGIKSSMSQDSVMIEFNGIPEFI